MNPTIFFIAVVLLVCPAPLINGQQHRSNKMKPPLIGEDSASHKRRTAGKKRHSSLSLSLFDQIKGGALSKRERQKERKERQKKKELKGTYQSRKKNLPPPVNVRPALRSSTRGRPSSSIYLYTSEFLKNEIIFFLFRYSSSS